VKFFAYRFTQPVGEQPYAVSPSERWTRSAMVLFCCPANETTPSPFSPAMRIEDMIDRATTSCIYFIGLKIFDVLFFNIKFDHLSYSEYF
jgi:hypothetical protein